MLISSLTYNRLLMPVVSCIFLFIGWQMTGETANPPGKESASEKPSERLSPLLPVGISLLFSFAAAIFLPFSVVGIFMTWVTGVICWSVVSAFQKKSTPCIFATVSLSLIPAAALCPVLPMFCDEHISFVLSMALLATLALLISMYLGRVSICRAYRWLHLAWKNEKRDIILILTCGPLAALLMSALFCVAESSFLPAEGISGNVLRVSFTLPVLLIYPLTLFILRLRTHLSETIRKEEAMEKWLKESRDYMNVIRSQRHDYNLHIHTLTGLLNTGEYEKALTYMHGMADETSDINEIMPVNDAALGSLLYNMRLEARRKGTDIHYKITYDMKDTLCGSFSCNKIIGNLLQNAIDAIKTPEDKAFGISMRIFKRRGNTVITVENRYTGNKEEILKAFEVGYTTKNHHDGIGLPMVQRTVTLEGGRIYPELEPEVLRFVVTLPNRITLESEEENS